MGRFLLICLGGALGTGARFLLSTWVAQAYGAEFPRGTALINISGSFLIAIVMELALAGVVPETMRLFLATGVLGGYTTYSSFNHETLRLADGGAFDLASLYLLLTVGGCLVAGVAGTALGRALARYALTG